MHSLPNSLPYYYHTPPRPHSNPRKLRKQSRTFGRGGAGNVLPSPPAPARAPVPVPARDSRNRSSSSPSLVTRLFSWIRSFRPRLSSHLPSQQSPPTSSLPTAGPEDQAFLESLVRYTEDASYRDYPYPRTSHSRSRSHRSNNEHTTHRVESSTSYPTPRSPNPNRMPYIRSPHPPSSYHSCSYATTSRPHPHANDPANSWYSSDTLSDDHDLDTTSRASTHSSLFYRPITRTPTFLDPPSRTPSQSRPSCVPRRRPEPLKITPTRPQPTPLQVSPILFASTLPSSAFRVPSIILSLPSATGEMEKFAFPTPPTHLHAIPESTRSSGYWLAGHTAFIPPLDFTEDHQAFTTEGWEAEMEENLDSESISSCRAAEDVELGSSSATFFTHDSETVTSPTIDLPTPSSETFSFGFSSTISAHLWGRQAMLKHDLSLDESHSTPSQSDISGNTPIRPGLIIDDDEDDDFEDEDEDAKFVGELESVYSAFADMNMGSVGGAIRRNTMFGMDDDTMSDTESVTDPHLHSVSVRIHQPRAWMGRA